MIRTVTLTALLLAVRPPLHAQSVDVQTPAQAEAQTQAQAQAQAQAPAPGPPQAQAPPPPPPQTLPLPPREHGLPASEASPPIQPASFEDTVVVSASRAGQRLIDAPAAVSIVRSETIERSSAANMGDLLRTVPGMNVAQLSARDVNLTTRGATGTLSTSQLALVDGRTIYLDFFGMVMWDLVPANLDEIERIEVIRGPASAVWGANAMSGVVNVITKSPRALAARGGGALTIGVGAFGRHTGRIHRRAGALFQVNGTHARAIDDHWSYKVSAGYRAQHALPRPTGLLPNTFRMPYPTYANTGTSQPKFDARVDYERPDDTRLSIAGGVAGTAGVIHSGLGPFDISPGSHMSYVSTRYQRGNRRVAFFANLLSGTASNVLSRGANGQPLPLAFDTTTIDIEASDVQTVGTRHMLTYGGNARHSRFDVSVAPGGDGRTEGGVYLQDEMFLSRYLRWVVGGRLDALSSIDAPVFSPRTTLLVKPGVNHTIRVSMNRAFRAPSLVNAHLDTTILGQAPPHPVSPVPEGPTVLVHAAGNPALLPETRTTYELGYSGVIAHRAVISAALYWSHTDHVIAFTPIVGDALVNPLRPRAGPNPPAVFDLMSARGLPTTYSYRNLGSVSDRGIEVGVEAAVGRRLNVFANASFQADPVVRGFDPSQVNAPPNRRLNAGVNADSARYFGSVSIGYTDHAYWQDVLDRRFAGTTRAYTLLNGSIGARWYDDRLVTAVKVTNLADREVLQHVFGDIIRRQITAEVRIRF